MIKLCCYKLSFKSKLLVEEKAVIKRQRQTIHSTAKGKGNTKEKD
jgi:hypothetical protein